MATPLLLKRLVSSQVVQWILSAIGAGYVVLVRWTSRIDRPAPPSQGPFVIAMWHGRLAMLHLLRHGDQALVALISNHRDGQLISKCAWHFGIRTVAGSTTRGGIGAAKRLIRLAQDGHSLFITPDGPRGPLMHVNEGVIEIARLTGLPILPVAIGTSGGKELKSWDRLLVPQPFSHVVVRWGEPLHVGREVDAAVAAARLEAELTALQQAADRAVDRRPPAGSI